jgi:hypothetical protein
MHESLLLVHLSAGVLTIVAGALAMALTKGSRLHRQAGNAFTLSILVLAISGGYLAYVKPEIITVINSFLVVYLVITGWLSGRSASMGGPWVTFAAAVVAIAIGVAHFMTGVSAANSIDGMRDGFPAPAFFAFGSVALLAAAGDVRLAIRRSLTSVQRVTRHLWRMGFLMFVATASFFLGQPQTLPEVLRHPLLLALPVVLVILVTITWLVRVRLSRHPPIAV